MSARSAAKGETDEGDEQRRATAGDINRLDYELFRLAAFSSKECASWGDSPRCGGFHPCWPEKKVVDFFHNRCNLLIMKSVV